MIKPDAKLSIARIPLDCIQVQQFEERYPEKLLDYIQLLLKHPDDYPGLLFVKPSDTHQRMFTLMDGHHKFCASLMTGRKDALCVVVDAEVKP